MFLPYESHTIRYYLFMQERLQKILSSRGIASRRKAEEYIAAGLVKVNGNIAKVGDKADPDVDRIEVDGKVLEARQEMLYYVMYKPVGVVTENVDRRGDRGDRGIRRDRRENSSSDSSDSSDSSVSSVRDLLPKNLQGKVYPVGRLDKDSAGLLLFTNDGVLAYRLTHPKFDHEKEYEVTTEEEVMEGQLMKLRRGIMLSSEKTKVAVVRKTGMKNFRIALTEGKNRQIRRMAQKVGLTVTRLIRVRIMTLEDAHLKPGMLRPLTTEERAQLLASVEL